MPKRSAIPVLIAATLGGAAIWFWQSRAPQPAVPEVPPPARTDFEEPVLQPPAADGELRLSSLASSPRWSSLDGWQEQVTRSEFLTLMEDVFTVSPKWRNWFHVGERDVLIETGDPDERYLLRFAPPGSSPPPSGQWRRAGELEPAPDGRPLEGLRIAIDPGHIGGRWAKIEERWFQVGEATPVAEGDMTLLVATLLRPRLEALGAKVELVRESTEPVTTYRPEHLLEQAQAQGGDSPRQLAERLFYRTAEIRARAAYVNRTLQPDLVLCLHFNAEAWGDPEKPTLVAGHHFHILLNGAYTDSELELADQRFHLTRKIVEGTHTEETAIARALTRSFFDHTGLPPYLYEANSSRAVNVDGNPYLWARNLLANRLYDCPVLFLEPYVMNSREDHARIQAGDYEGLREVAGEPRPSIFREYADSIADGLARYYREARPKTS